SRGSWPSCRAPPHRERTVHGRRDGLTSFGTTRKEVDQITADAAAVFMFHGQKAPAGIGNKKLRDSLSAVLEEERFEGKSGQVAVMSANGQFPARRYIVVGLGKKEKFSPSVLRDAVAIAARRAEVARASHLALTIPGEGAGKIAAQ